MSVLKDKAMIVAQGLVRSHGLDPSLTALGDGTFLEWLMKLFEEILPSLLKCFGLQRTPKALADVLHSPSFWQRRRLRVEIRSRLRDAPSEDVLARPLETQIWKMCDGITEADAQSLIEEVTA